METKTATFILMVVDPKTCDLKEITFHNTRESIDNMIAGDRTVRYINDMPSVSYIVYRKQYYPER